MLEVLSKENINVVYVCKGFLQIGVLMLFQYGADILMMSRNRWGRRFIDVVSISLNIVPMRVVSDQLVILKFVKSISQDKYC